MQDREKPVYARRCYLCDLGSESRRGILELQIEKATGQETQYICALGKKGISCQMPTIYDFHRTILSLTGRAINSRKK